MTQQRPAGRGRNPASLANLVKFKPGQSGNPSGRPKGMHEQSIAASLRRMLASECPTEFVARVFGKKFASSIDTDMTGAQLAAMVLLNLGLRGDLDALKLMLAYCDGDPKQSLELSGQVDSVVTVEHLREALRRVS